MAPLTAPRGLGAAGRKLWRSIADPETAWDLRADELAVLARACKVADRIDVLDKQLDELLVADPADGLITSGSMGQEVEHPVLTALTKHDALLQRLLASLKLPDLATGGSSGSTSENARKAAQARWSRPRNSSGSRPGRAPSTESA